MKLLVKKMDVWKAYYRNGELYVEQYYLAGGLLGVKSWYENGQLKIEMIKNLIIDEALRYIETVEIEYYENGQLKKVRKNITKIVLYMRLKCGMKMVN